MDFDNYEMERRFHEMWDSVSIVRPVHCSLFTFGESQLPYYLVSDVKPPRVTVSIMQGEIRITRPMIITPQNSTPEFQNFFESADEEEMVQFLLARTASFPHLKFDNTSRPTGIRSDSVEEAITVLNRKLDAEDEDRVAILTAPANLGGIALLRYAMDRVIQSQDDNIQELRERGFLP